MLSSPAYLAHLDANSHLLAAAAARGLEASVPGCPGWSITDLLDHVSKVYSSRIDIVEQHLVDRWPPRRSRPEQVDPLPWFRSQSCRLVEVLADADPAAPAITFAREQTIGFWIRRMAHETLIHRIDAEQAHSYRSAIDAELALDGIAEMFDVFITRRSDIDEFVPSDTVVKVASGGRIWTARLGRRIDRSRAGDTEVPMAIVAEVATPDATFSGDPEEVLLWIWGRAPLAGIAVDGPVDVAHRFRQVCSI